MKSNLYTDPYLTLSLMEADLKNFFESAENEVARYDGVRNTRESERYNAEFEKLRKGPDWNSVRDNKLDFEEYCSLMLNEEGIPRFDLENSKYGVYKMAFELFDDDNSGSTNPDPSPSPKPNPNANTNPNWIQVPFRRMNFPTLCVPLDRRMLRITSCS